MRIHFTSITRAELLRKRLHELLRAHTADPRLTRSADVLALMLGYIDWADLKKNLESEGPSPFDENLPDSVRRERHRHQREALAKAEPSLRADIVQRIVDILSPSGRSAKTAESTAPTEQARRPEWGRRWGWQGISRSSRGNRPSA